MAAVLTLQALCDYSGREAAEAVRFDVRWKVAIGAPLDDPGLPDPSLAGVLAEAEDALETACAPGRNDAVRARSIEQTGVLTGGWRQRGGLDDLGRMRWHQDTWANWSRLGYPAGRPGRCQH